MFDIGFFELLVVFVVGLLILGPERLPHAAKTAGLWIRKIRRTMHSVQREINMQLDQEELQRKIADNNQQIMKETEGAIQNTITPLPESAIAASSDNESDQKPVDTDSHSADKELEQKPANPIESEASEDKNKLSSHSTTG